METQLCQLQQIEEKQLKKRLVKNNELQYY